MTEHGRSYRFADFTLDPAERLLRRGDREVVLRTKAFETLLCLVQNHGRVVPKSKLLDAVWPDTTVSDAVLTHCIAEVRRALCDEVRQPRFVKTLSRHGYKFIAPVTVSEAPANEAAPAAEPAAAAAAPPPTAIVVLPFANMSADPENEHFCDGLSEELINGLTKTGGLHVVAHTSSFAFKRRDVDAREIGRQLGVARILEGSVRKTGDRLRVSAQLIDAARGYHIWSEQYDRRLEDVFAIQDEISQAILASIEPQLLGAKGPPVRPPTADMKAYELYLQGRAFWHRRYGGGLQKAMDSFGQAIARDPGFAPPYTGLADSLSTLGIWGLSPPRDVYPKAAALADTALRLDPNLAEAHASRALVKMFWEWDWSAAERSLRRALELNPGCALIRLWWGHYLSIVGRMDEGLAEVTRAQALDPLSPVCSANVGFTFYLAHDLDRSEAELRAVLAREPDNGIALFYLGFTLLDGGRPEEAIGVLRRAHQVTRGMAWSAEGIALAEALLGRPECARAALAEAPARRKAGYVPSSAIALLHLGLGDDAAFLTLLESAVEERDALLPWLKFMPTFDRLHGQPRFDAVLRRVGLA